MTSEDVARKIEGIRMLRTRVHSMKNRKLLDVRHTQRCDVMSSTCSWNNRKPCRGLAPVSMLFHDETLQASSFLIET